MKKLVTCIYILCFLACSPPEEPSSVVYDTVPGPVLKDSSPHVRVIPVLQDKVADTAAGNAVPVVNTGLTTPGELVDFAQTLIGVPYVYASSDPAKGFDCSGFITYVFSHFHIQVPRSSVDFTYVGKTVPLTEARRGDIILFTGTDSLETEVGHMGLVVSNQDDGLRFIHATSGKAMAVTISPLTPQYRRRFVRVGRVFS
jgi:cell wall-associated NlpC family hydrolase